VMKKHSAKSGDHYEGKRRIGQGREQRNEFRYKSGSTNRPKSARLRVEKEFLPADTGSRSPHGLGSLGL